MLEDTYHITPWSEHNNGFLSHSGPLRSDSSPSGCSPRTVPPQTAPPEPPSLLSPQHIEPAAASGSSFPLTAPSVYNTLS